MAEAVITKRTRVIFICQHCSRIIGDTGLCSYECDYDDAPVSERPQGSVVKKTWNVVETLLSEEVI
jgi:hypothetical protein